MKSEEIKKLVAKSENAAVEFKRAKGVTAARNGKIFNLYSSVGL